MIETRSVISLICGIIVVGALSLTWWDMECADVLFRTSVQIGGEASGWGVLGGDISWVGVIGPGLVLVGGVLLIGCVLGAIIIPRIQSFSDSIFTKLAIAARVIPVIVLLGAIFFMIDCRNDNCEYGSFVPIKGYGYGLWLAIVAAVIGVISGVERPIIVAKSSKTDMKKLRKKQASQEAASYQPSALRQKLDSDVGGSSKKAADIAKELFNLASDDDEKGNHRQAMDSYNRAIKSDPMFVQAYFNRGLLHKKLGNNAEAIADLQKSVDLSDDQDIIQDANRHIAELNG